MPPATQPPAKRTNPLAGTLRNLRQKSEEQLSSLRKKTGETRAAAKHDAQAARVMSVIEAPVAAAAAGVGDAFVDPIVGIVPWSAPVGLAVALGGILLKQNDLTAVGVGLLSGGSYGTAQNLVRRFAAAAQ